MTEREQSLRPGQVTALTPEQAAFARRCVGRWLEVKERHEPLRGVAKGALRRWRDGELGVLRVDADHSALLMWLLTGHEPFRNPPPLRNAYPDYQAADGEPEFEEPRS